MITHNVGDTFLLKAPNSSNITLMIVKDDEDNICDECYFELCGYNCEDIDTLIEPCAARLRPDHTAVHFIEVK